MVPNNNLSFLKTTLQFKATYYENEAVFLKKFSYIMHAK